jgi:bacteriocin biosynthesis cyclodehydratase domain-containing protein
VRLRPNARWRLLLEDGRLVASGGADELYLVDELTEAECASVAAAFEGDALDGLPRAGAVGATLDRFERMGVVVRRVEPQPALRIAMIGGESLAPLVGKLVPVNEAGLVFVVRTGGGLVEVAEKSPAAPHVLVDLAYHHTVSIGPLVWPGETPCLSCFAGRIRQRWGDPLPPPSPGATESLAFAAGLVAEIARRFAAEGTHDGLVEHVVAFDLRTLSSQRERIHRLPWCPRCFPDTLPAGGGAFAEPWTPPTGAT